MNDWRATVCWHCGSKNYKDTVDAEWCPDCGIRCNYNGPNAGVNTEWEQAEHARRTQYQNQIDAEWEDLQNPDEIQPPG